MFNTCHADVKIGTEFHVEIGNMAHYFSV